MIPQSSVRRVSLPWPRIPRGRLGQLAALVGFAALLAASTLWGVYEGMHLYRLKVATSFADFLDDVVATRLAIVPNWVAGQLTSDAEHLVFDIKHVEFQKLAYQRELALERGLLLTSPEDFVPIRIRHDGRTVKAKARLKGDWADHISGDKWSYRVKVNGDETVLGMKVFSLHHPGARRFVYEWVFHQALAREGLIPLRYEFVELTVNGKDGGVYALEEHFDKRLIEHNGQREGPILKFDESLHWLDIHATGRRGGASPTGLRSFRAGAPDAFRTGSLQRKPAQWQAFLAAATLIEDFRAGEYRVAEVFDQRKLATYFALLDLLGAHHAASWINLRFYHNPLSGRLEPVGFDGNAGAPLKTVLGSTELLEEAAPDLKSRIFADTAFVAEYVAALERVSEPAYLGALLVEIEEELEANLRILHKEFPWARFDKGILVENQRTIRSVLRPARTLRAHLDEAGSGGMRLELANLGALPIEVVGLRFGERVLDLEEPVVVPATSFSTGLRWQAVDFPARTPLAWPGDGSAAIEVTHRLLGASHTRSDAVIAWPRRVPSIVSNDLTRLAPSFDEFDFLRVDEATNTLRILPGSWKIDRDLVIPAGFRVHCSGGTRLDLSRSAAILSRSPLDFRGSADAPIVIESSDGSGQGLLVLGAVQRSTLEYVSFLKLRNPARGSWQLTGAVTFYESPVTLSHAAFVSNLSEDGLNVVRSDFEIEATLFRNSFSDAFDADFSDGVIRDSRFVDAGNDAIDVSGGRVTVVSVEIVGAGDKGLSAGEQAELSIRDVEVRSVRIGVASKDRSLVRVRSLSVEGAEVGLALYSKKSEFGPSTMEVRGLNLESVETRYLVEQGSELTLEGRGVDSNARSVHAQLYGSDSD